MKKAAIVSNNVDLIRFFELELSLYGYSFDVFSKAEDVTCDYAFCAVDTAFESIDGEKEYAAKTVGVSWPISVFVIRNLCLGSVDSKEEIVGDKLQMDVVYSIDGQGTISLFGKKVRLSATEYAVLCALCDAKGEVVLREDLMRLLDAREGNVADVYVCNLRKKLSLATEKKVIITERGRGYRTNLKLIK